MKKLYDLVDLVENNRECVILKVKDDTDPLELIKLGYFDGNETMFRVTKGDEHTATIFKSGSKAFSWHWGLGGHTLVSDKTQKAQTIIVNTILDDFGISLGRFVC